MTPMSMKSQATQREPLRSFFWLISDGFAVLRTGCLHLLLLPNRRLIRARGTVYFTFCETGYRIHVIYQLWRHLWKIVGKILSDFCVQFLHNQTCKFQLHHRRTQIRLLVVRENAVSLSSGPPLNFTLKTNRFTLVFAQSGNSS